MARLINRIPVKQEDSGNDLFSVSRRGQIGRPKGQGTKRKSSEALSQNPHTVKSRNRVANFTAEEKEVEAAKKADRAAIKYHTDRLKEKEEYTRATPTEQQAMIVATKEWVIDKR